jgi:hypothetical protein
VAIATTAVLANPAPAHAAEQWPIYSRWSDMCLQPANGSTEQGVAIVQQRCDTNRPAGLPLVQTWTLIPKSGNIFQLKNSFSQLCLDVRGLAVDRTPVQQWPCNWISNENWQWGPTDSNGDRQLISRVSGTRTHCLDIPGAQMIEPLEMWIYHCTVNNVAQQWWYGPGLNPD